MSDLARKYDIRNPQSSEPPPWHADHSPHCHAERSEASALSMKTTGIIHVFAECDDSEITRPDAGTPKNTSSAGATASKSTWAKSKWERGPNGHALRIRTSRNENAWELGTGWHSTLTPTHNRGCVMRLLNPL